MSAEVAAPTAPGAPADEHTPVIKDMTTGEPKEATAVETNDTPVEAAIAAVLPGSTTEEKVNDSEVKVTATPVTSGTLGYKAPGLVKYVLHTLMSLQIFRLIDTHSQIRFKKHYVWLGEEAPVPVSELSSYLRGEKPKFAHPTAAWSNKTGKGLLYVTKDSETKEKPTGIINLVSQ